MTNSESAFGRAVRDFTRGLVEASPVSWIGAMLVCLVEIGLCCVLLVPDRIARLDPRYLMESPGDEYCLLSVKLMKLRFARLTGLHVAYVGGSQATRALLTRDPDRLSQMLSRATGARATFHVMSSNNQRYEDALGIVDQLPRSFRGAFVMMVSDYKDDYPANDKKIRAMRQRIAFASVPSLLPFWREVGDYEPPRTDVFFLDHFGFFAARRLAALRFSKVPGDGIAGAGGVKVEKQRQAIAKLEQEREEASEEGHPALKRRLRQRAPMLGKSRKLMVRLITNLKARQIVPVFIEFPHHPLRHEIYRERNDRFQREFAEFAQFHHVIYWDLNPEMDLTVDDFQDSIHLGTPRARRQFQVALMRHLGPFLRARFIEGNASGDASAETGDTVDEPPAGDGDDDADNDGDGDDEGEGEGAKPAAP